MFLTPLLILVSAVKVQGLCGDSIRWSHHFNMDDVYGLWYGVGYAQHTPDMTNQPNEIGCVTLYITDVTTESQNDWLDWSIIRRNYTDQNWKSYKSNPWSGTSMSGSWMDIRIKRKMKRNIYDEKRVRVMWDEDGQTIEQTYNYSPDAPGLWTVEQRTALEKEMIARGIDLWYPNEPPKHPQAVRILKVTPQMLIINHCSEIGDGGIFSLVLRRLPSRMNKWEWYDLQKQFFSYDLPPTHRYTAVCDGCVQMSSLIFISLCVTMSVLL
ncbi:uncharacterized protein LOC115445107 [Manduca sexta]|uniref:uncharacterized protein LOC115445107 n=1 Tax=Manduca sexta TaxID=7130 RepID=UPI00188FE6CB|nr:uncharacterized protein LOC115445107 [Manduca sexta]